MAEVQLRVGGRIYDLACRDGDEPRIRRLAAMVDAHAAGLSARLGGMSEGRLLLSAALMLADELDELRAEADRTAERLDALAAKLESGGPPA